MERLGDDARGLLRTVGVPDAGALAAVVRAWPAAVGPAVSRAAWPLRISRDGTLHVATVSSTWAFELTTLSGEVQEKLAQAVGPVAPTSIRFAPGPVPEPAGEPAPAERRAPVPTPDEEAAARAVASAIEDEDLRETVRRAAAASLAAARSDRVV
jgi:hypothetical protein